MLHPSRLKLFLAALLTSLPLQAHAEDDQLAALRRDGYPAWAISVGKAYLDSSATEFLMYGAVHANVKVKEEGKLTSRTWREFWGEDMFGTRGVVLFYDRAKGITGANPASIEAFTKFEATRSKRDPRPTSPLRQLDAYLRGMAKTRTSVAVVVDHLETLFPKGEPHDELVELVRGWGSDADLRAADLTVVLLTEKLADAPRELTSSRATIQLEVTAAR